MDPAPEHEAPPRDTPPATPDGELAQIIERNIHALLERKRAQQRLKSFQDRAADSITRFTGSMLFVYLHLILFGAWIILNLPWIPGPKFDPTYVVLAMWASVEAIFLSTFVLITQNRMAAEADRRAELDLQISLLAEHEITRLITLVAAIAKRMNIEAAHSSELAELEKDVQPEQVLDEMEKIEAKPERQ